MNTDKILETLLRGGPSALKLVVPLTTLYTKLSKPGDIKLPKLTLATSYETFEVERGEIMARAAWLCRKLNVSPSRIVRENSVLTGDYYGPQWAIYTVCMTMTALSNIMRLWPEEKPRFLPVMAHLADVLLSPELRAYDAREWNEDPLETLEGNKSHMTYLSLVAWSLSNYLEVGGDNRHAPLYAACCDTLHRRMQQQRDLNLLSFPRRPVFFPDMLVAIAALTSYGRICDNRYADTVAQWVDNARTLWCDPATNLLASTLQGGKLGTVRGCYSAFNTYWLNYVDTPFFIERYDEMKRWLRHNGRLGGIREYRHSAPQFKFDPNAGPIVMGTGATATAVAVGCATAAGDWEFRNELLRLCELVGQSTTRDGRRHYKLASVVPGGEAILLAMRTTVPLLAKDVKKNP